MKYGRGVVVKGELWDRVAELKIDRVEVRNDILERQLTDADISNAWRRELANELGGIATRWESSRSEEEADQKKRPLHNSQEWGGIEKGTKKRPRS